MNLPGDKGHVGRSGSAEYQRNAEQHERRCGRPIDKVLKSGFSGLHAVSVHAAHDIRGDRHELKIDEKDHEVVGRNHDRHARGGGQYKRIIFFAEFQIHPLEIRRGRKQGHARNRKAKQSAKLGKRVKVKHARKKRAGNIPCLRKKSPCNKR